MADTCALRGCDPKKVLVGIAELVDWSRRMQGKGIAAPGLSLHWPDLTRFKRTFTDPVPEGTEHSFVEAGITLCYGRACFLDRTTIQVGNDILASRHVVITTGARHAPLGIPGEEWLTTSTQFLDLDDLPPRIAFVGGGYIAFEFAHIAARAGAQIQILHRGSHPFKQFDPDLVARLVQTTRELGVEVRLNTEVMAIERQGDHLLVHARTGEQGHTVETDLVVHARSDRGSILQRLDNVVIRYPHADIIQLVRTVLLTCSQCAHQKCALCPPEAVTRSAPCSPQCSFLRQLLPLWSWARNSSRAGLPSEMTVPFNT